MGFIIRNITSGPAFDVELLDIGITIPAGVDFDLITEQPNDIAMSLDLVAAITAGSLIALDPLDNATPLTIAQSIEMVEVHNDPHYRIRGGTLNQLDDVNIDGAGSPLDLTNMVLQWNNVDAFEPTTPDDLIGGTSGTINGIIAALLVDGVNTTVTETGSPLTSIQVDVDDVFLMNTGDTLDSGTLTIASGAGIDVLSGGTITIQDGATASIITPTGGFDDPSDLVNKEYVDSIAAGLDPKESVRVATEVGDTGGTAVQASPCGPGDQITGFPGIIDGVTLVAADRVLVKDRTNAQENGIYTVTTVNATSPLTVDLTRAEDQDGSPANEVSAGNFTHVEQGSQNINTKWMVTGDGILTLCSDDIDWVLFSGPDTILADVGLTRVANTISLDVGDLAGGTPVITDTIAFHDPNGVAQGVAGSQTYSTTFGTVFNELDVVYGISGNGIVVRTADDTYASRTIVASALEDRVGLEVLNGDGVAGNPTVGLDIEGLPYVTAGSPGGAIAVTDRVPVWDADLDRNVYYQVQDIAGALSSTNSFTNWQATGTSDTGGPNVAASSTDTMTMVGGTGISLALTAGTDTIQYNLNFANLPAPGSPLGIDTSDEIIINNGGTIEKVTLGDLIDALGITTTDETVKVSANDTTAGFLNGKLVAGTYTTLTENNDGANETLTVDVDPSTISIDDLQNVTYGSPTAGDGDVLVYRLIGSPEVGTWVNEPASSFGTVDFAFRTISGDTGSVVANVAEDIIKLSGGAGISTAATGSPQEVVFNIDFSTLPATGSPTSVTGDTEIIINNGGTVETTTLNELIAQTLTGGNGIDISYQGSPEELTVSMDVCGLTAGSTATLDSSDTIAVCDGGSTVGFTLEEVLDTLGVPSGITGEGIVVKVAGSPESYATRDVIESTTAGLEGGNVVNGDGQSGDIEIGVDIDNLGNSADDLAAADEAIIFDGTNNVSMTGQQIADGVSTILNLPDILIEDINGQQIVTYTDPTRGTGSPLSGKRLSTDMVQYSWEENTVGNNDWVRLGGATDALTGHVMPMDATIVGIVAHTSDDGGNSKGIRLYIDGTPHATDPLFSFTAVTGENSYNSFVSMNLDIDVAQGEKIRLRGAATGGTIQDTVITIYIRWRS